MTNKSFTPLRREQFALLCEAKRLVSREFGETLMLQDSNLIEQIQLFAQTSKSTRLVEISKELTSSANSNITQNTVTPKVAPQKGELKNNITNIASTKDTIKVGDIVNGKICAGFYRGQPTYK